MGLIAGLKENLSSSILIYSEYFFKVLYFNAYALSMVNYDWAIFELRVNTCFILFYLRCQGSGIVNKE